jgi:ATP-dependent Clp protease ATP-binding subunit ClpA
VVEKVLVEVETQLEQKGVQLAINDEARGWLADHGYDPKMGARPMARLIQDQIKRPLAEELLFGRLAGGGQVMVSVAEDGNSLTLTISPMSRPVLPQPEGLNAD